MQNNIGSFVFRLGAVGLAVATFGCATVQERRYRSVSKQIEQVNPARNGGDEEVLLPFGGTLTRSAFVRAVLSRNPNLEAARQAWRAALAKYPQTDALPDPRVEYSFAPLSIGSDSVRYGQVIGVRQQFPWPGKLALAGKSTLADAEAMGEHYNHSRQELALIASQLFDDYYAVTRSLELNREHKDLVKNIKATAEAQYKAGRASQQEPLQAEVELSHVIHRDVVLTSRRKVIVAGMNGLLRQPPEHPLPAPPRSLAMAAKQTETTSALQERALAKRPEILALHFNIEARESAKQLANKSYYPDFAVAGTYNSMWRETEHQWMLGVSLNIPLQLGARKGAVDQAEAELRQAKAELASATDNARVDIERARLGLEEAEHVIHLYQTRLLPAARAHIEAARIGYETGRGSFQSYIDAERSLRTLELEFEQAVAQVGKKNAALERALGLVPGLANSGDVK